MALRKNLTYLLIILLSFLMMPLKSFGASWEKPVKKYSIYEKRTALQSVL